MTTRQRAHWGVVGAAWVCGATMLVLGAWAFFAPRSFGDFIDYEPYNKHLLHDVGAFQLGIGVTTLLATVASDVLLLGLVGFAVASGMHTVSHILDHNLGGHDTDIPALALLTLLAVAAIVVRLRLRGREP